MRLFKVSLCLCVFSGCIATALDLTFQVNKSIALFYKAYHEGEKEKKLHEEISGSFGTLTSSPEEKAEFIANLADAKRKYEHKYMTPKFKELWEEASKEFDRRFDSDANILNDKVLAFRDFIKKILRRNVVDFSRVLRFYNSKARSKFNVYICSTDKNSGSFAQAYGNNIVLRFTAGQQYAADICAILEQVCHTLAQNRSPRDEQNIKNYFLKSKDENALPAYFMFDDIVAYVIGQLWAHSQMPEPRDSQPTLNIDPNLEQLARSLLPVVEEYLTKNKRMDKNFLDKYMDRVNLQVPNAHKSYAYMLQKICLIVEPGIDVPECKSLIKAEFEVKEIKDKTGDYSTVFIGKNLGATALKNIQDQLPHEQNDFLFVTKDKKTGQLFVIIYANELEKIKKAIQELRAQESITSDYRKDL